MKTKLIGLIVVLAAIAAAVIYVTVGRKTQVTALNGYVGGEKIGFLEDQEVQDILRKDYHLSLEYSKAGSLDMVTADKEGKDFLWPSSQTALEYYKSEVGKPVRSETVFNTPIVIYTRKAVSDALQKEGTVYGPGRHLLCGSG